MDRVVVSEFSQMQKLNPIILLVVDGETKMLMEQPVAFVDLPWSESVCLVEPGFVSLPRFLRSRRRPLNVFRPLLEVSDACRQQLLSTYIIGPIDYHPGGNRPLNRMMGFCLNMSSVGIYLVTELCVVLFAHSA